MGSHVPVRRLILVRHAATSATRTAAFALDEPLDERGRADAASLAGRLPSHDELVCSPARRCIETAAAARLGGPSLHPSLAECDFGDWAGRTLADVHEDDPEAAAAWMTDPAACPHGGESLAAFAIRVACWLCDQARRDGRVLAITHGGVVKAAVVHALGAPLSAFWRVDCAPLSITELHAHDGRWTVARMNSTCARRRCRTMSALGCEVAR
jgi:broad specificity phosphatase PhoE